jgi:hypothetical protein
MRLRMQSAEQVSGLRMPTWDVSLVGEPVDDRGRASLSLLTAQRQLRHVTFRPSTIDALYDGARMEVEALEDALRDVVATHRVVLDATTLGVVEILLLFRAAAEAEACVGLLYTEPARYLRGRRSALLNRRDFLLSDEVRPFTSVPGAATLITEQTRAVCFVGFEGERLEQALEQTGVRPHTCNVVFGVPAFQAGWETDSFANNIRVVRTRGLEPGNIRFAGAHNPAAAWRTLNEIYGALAIGQRMVVLPLGTKPHAIGAALFACQHSVGLIFDFPTHSQGRSQQVARWHYFEVDFKKDGL